MLPFIRKRKQERESEAGKAAPVTPEPAVDDEASRTTPGVRMLKEVWHIDARKKKEMPPPDVPTDIYRVPRERTMRPRHGQNT